MGAGANALLVEDDADVGALLGHHLRALHYRVQHVTTAEEALACIAERSPDLAVVDICLPGADGRTVVRALRAAPEHHGCRIIVATIVDRDDLDVEADAFLAKPFRRTDVVRALECAGLGGDAA